MDGISAKAGMAIVALAAWASFPSAAATLYKSVGPNGTIMFSDAPPADGSTLLDQRDMAGEDTVLTPMEQVFAGLQADADLARANTQLDLAEHALALARRSNWSAREGLRLEWQRMTPADEARVTFYQRNVQAARQAFLDKLRQRKLASK